MVILEKGESKVIECPTSECEYKGVWIGQHWRHNPGHRQWFTDEQMEILKGITMSDGTVYKKDKDSNPRVQVGGFITLEYLEYLDDLFGALSTGVRPDKTAKEKSKENRETGFSPNAKSENYSDGFFWLTRNHPQLEVLDSWYKGNGHEKEWPPGINLTPLVLKHLYCGDGYWSNKNTANHIEIAMSNEQENQDKVTSIFENAGIPGPNNYDEYRERDGSIGCKAVFSVTQSRELWEYMGSPPPGFEYKWPEEYR